MPKVADFLKGLVTKAGINIEQNEAVKAALAALPADLELSGDLSTAIDNGLLSIAAAKNNHPDIKGHYFAQAYKGLDNEMETYLEAEKLPEEVLAELKAEGSSTKRAILLAKKIKDLEGKKSNAGKADKDEFQKQLASLQEALRLEKEGKQDLLAKHKEEVHNVRRDHILSGLMGSYKTTFDTLDPSTKQIVLNNIITKNLAAKKAKFLIDDTGNLNLVGEDGSNVFGEDHKLLTPKGFLDGVMAAEKILVVNETPPGPNGQQHSGHNRQQQPAYQRQQQPSTGNPAPKGNSYLQSLIGESLNDFNKSTAQR